MSTATVSELQITNLNQAYLIQLPIILNTLEGAALKQTFNRLCKTHSNNVSIVLDFSRTEFIESKEIDVLLDTVKVAKKEEIDLAFWSVSPQIKMQLSSANPELISRIERGTDSIYINSKQSISLVQELKPIIKSIVARLNWNSTALMRIKRLTS